MKKQTGRSYGRKHAAAAEAGTQRRRTGRSASGKNSAPHGKLWTALLCGLLTLSGMFPADAGAGENALHPNQVINLAGAWAQGYTGKGVTVGVIDTPINPDHPALDGKVTEFPPNYGFWGPPSELDWTTVDHGSHVAGIIAAAPSAGNMQGIAYDADIWSGVWRIPGHYLYFDLLDAKNYFAARPDVKVYNCSWSSFWDRNLQLSSDDAVRKFTADKLQNALYQNSLDKGTLFVFAPVTTVRAFPPTKPSSPASPVRATCPHG